MESAAHAPLPEEDALASLEERIRRAADLVTQLRAERDAAVAEVDNIRKAAGGALAESQKLRQELENLRGERKQVRLESRSCWGRWNCCSVRGTMDAGSGPKTVRVTIFHQQYSVSATDDAGEIEQLAQEIDELMNSIAPTSRKRRRHARRRAGLPPYGGPSPHHRARIAGPQGPGRRKSPASFHFCWTKPSNDLPDSRFHRS